jgi:glycosyltransferase involved in cell wall biosynthesis
MRSSAARSPGRPSLLACPTIPHTVAPEAPESKPTALACSAAVTRRIAFIDYFATHYRRRLYEELARRMDVDFYFFADERERYWNRKIPLVRAGDFRRVELPRYRIAGQAVMPGVAPRILSGRYDAVIKSLNGKLMLPLVYGSSRARGVPFVLWTGMWFHPVSAVHRLTQPLTHHVYRSVEAIVAYGEHVKRFVCETPGVEADKVFVAGQAVEPERFTVVERSANGPAEILYVGQFERHKGITDLLAAFPHVADQGARLRLVGNGSLEPEVGRHAARDARIEIVGYLPQDRLPEPLARARCLVLPSITTTLDREPWGLVINEAMHAGVPVIATDAVGAAAGGLVEHDRNGLIVPERDPGALARAMSRLADDAELAARLGDQARRDVERFTHRAMADAFEAAVEHAIATSSR